ncbi:formylmethanofuran dehydrogenase subunit C [Paraburkholderia sp. HC6.4b]|uniref:hypothetical protein n=1 Tax=unclassified Paraburkholderia TaxID=2615204 RepID=UPI00160869E3|nr:MULTISPECIES: hypothetical protein [unclassified Paraburkholderia]MBB5408620.1 formylmethanofuran dehydrogenase subunit C [Paraburkholderia sp. HC6.4b]MBB5450452.1 formylmethanofuran dehydrogenase subunit C [Paraburkholderia sp. Kb1A]
MGIQTVLRAALCALVACLLASCTVIYIEGNANTVSGIEGHTGTVKVPSSLRDSAQSQ